MRRTYAYLKDGTKFSRTKIEFSSLELDLAKRLELADLAAVVDHFRKQTKHDESRHISLLSTLRDLDLEEKYNETL